MNFYFFRYIAVTRLAFSDWKIHQEREQKGVKNNYPAINAEMLVFDRRIKKNNFFHHYGLGFDVKVPAKSKSEAASIAETLVLNFIGTLCFLEKTHVAPPQCILSYRYPENPKNKLEEYSATLLDESIFPISAASSIRLINHQNLGFFLEKLIPSDRDTQEKILYSLHWFWKAVGVNDKRDQFTNLWVALEILEPALKRFYKYSASKRSYPTCGGCGDVAKTCPSCKKDFGYQANTGFAGFKSLETEILDGTVIKFRTLHSNRSGLVHSGGHISVDEVDKSIFSTRVLIGAAILKLLNFKDYSSDAVLLAKNNFKQATTLPTLMEIRGNITVKEVAVIDNFEKQPSVSAEYTHEYGIDGDDLLPTYSVRHEFNEVFLEGQVERIIKVDSSQNIKDVWEIKV